MSTHSGTTLNPEIDILEGSVKKNSSGSVLPLTTTPASSPAVTTYFYRVLATGVRGTTTTLSGIPVGSVIEGTSTT